MNKKMTSLMLGFSMITCAAIAGSTVGQKKMVGTYGFRSASMIDPAPSERKDRVVFWMEGYMAKDIYLKLPGRAKKDECSDELLTKSSGDLRCSFDVRDRTYMCSLGVMLANGKTAIGSVC